MSRISMTLGLLSSSFIPGSVQGGSFHNPVWSAPDKVGAGSTRIDACFRAGIKNESNAKAN